MAYSPNSHVPTVDYFPTDSSPEHGLTTFFIVNLHCPSCSHVVHAALNTLNPAPQFVSVSIISHSVTIRHLSSLSIQTLQDALDAAGFEIHSVFSDEQVSGFPPEHQYGSEWADSLNESINTWRRKWKLSQQTERAQSRSTAPDHTVATESADMGKKRTHAEQCAECRAELAGGSSSEGAVPLEVLPAFISPSDSKTGVATETRELSVTPVEVKKDAFVVVDSTSEANIYQAELSVIGMTCSACVASITRAIEAQPWVRTISVSLLTNSASVIFEGKQHAEEVVKTIEDAGFDASIENLEQLKSQGGNGKGSEAKSDLWRAEYAIGGMTCSACSGTVTSTLDRLPFVESVEINLIANSGTVVFEGKDNAAAITEAIEDAGFDATLDKLENVGETLAVDLKYREVSIKVDAMYCHHCPPRILNVLRQTYGDSLEILKELTLDDPILAIKYLARPPDFTIRHILTAINSLDAAFVTTIFHPPTIEDRSREMHARERKRILFRLALSVSAAVPAFIIGIVCMNLLKSHDATRMFMMHTMWAGSVSRAEWALFILATPIYFFAADTFHKRAIKEIKAMWRPGSQVPILHRFIRFGSMNMLMSLGTSIAYFSSIAELALAATQEPMDGMPMGATETNYFDSVIFLTMFLLMGRFIEAYSKAKTGDAVTSLGKLRPSEAILIEEANVTGRKLGVDLLDVGDVVLVPNGCSPPFDGIVIDGSARFDESSLTGESRPVPKEIGDAVFSGTVNKGGPISIRLTSVSGSSMLDQIIKIVREGQTRRAPIERAADTITSHFVPFVVMVGIITWLIWLTLGLSKTLPEHWVEGQLGGWPLWALRFAIAVFVIACPCGIGLAAPTALFVGGGMAAKSGILVKGGGEAFQEASTLDCIVFDKTGTLTTGGDPAVVEYRQATEDDEKEVLGMIKRLEENSSHPIAKAMVNFCASRSNQTYIASEIKETPGKGMSGKFRVGEESDSSLDVELLVGNEALMDDASVNVDPASWAALQYWKRAGNSVVLAATRSTKAFADPDETQWQLSCMFAVADPLRPEAKSTIKALQNRGIAVWMLSGDNPTTAQAVGEMVGIPAENVIAGVMPDQKAEKIQYLQKTLPKPKRRPRATVAMVGDGINDSPALTMADVGIAIGSGSDVAISSAAFILISSDLSALLTLIDLSRTVFRRVWFNFGWALVYNIIAMPVAAGVLYPIRSKGQHVKLDPVWASLAMAMSSVSVICSSLLLRSRIPFVGFRSKPLPAQ